MTKKINTSIITNNLASYLWVSSPDRCDLFSKFPFCFPAELLLACRCLDHRGRLVEMGAESRTVAAHLHNHCDTSVTTSDHCTTERVIYWQISTQSMMTGKILKRDLVVRGLWLHHKALKTQTRPVFSKLALTYIAFTLCIRHPRLKL